MATAALALEPALQIKRHKIFFTVNLNTLEAAPKLDTLFTLIGDQNRFQILAKHWVSVYTLLDYPFQEFS